MSHNKEDLSNEIDSQTERLREVNEKFRELSIRDELTGLYRHRYFQERLYEEFARARRYGHPLSCLVVDIDLFRRINENLGRRVGNEILKGVATVLIKNCRSSDLVGRYSGEEFVVLLPHVDYQGALEFAERLRRIFQEQTFLSNSHRISLTVSIGVSSFPQDAVNQPINLLRFADQALSWAKVGGRNRVVLYRDVVSLLGGSGSYFQMSEEKILEFQSRLAEVVDKARRGYLESSKVLMSALDTKDHYTAGHGGNVGRLAREIAETMGLSLDEAETVEYAGLLHDVGKICISDEILRKPARFNPAEYEAMKQHTYFGYRIVKPIKFLHEETLLILHHHEWYNGEGYPCRLSKEEIPLGARIISVIDAYDTMREAGRRYKETVSIEEAANELIRYAGTQFDPEVVQAFIQVLLIRKELDANAYNKKLLQQALERDSPQ